MDKKKIGLILAYRGVNYGMLLQAFATQQFIEKQGYETEILEYTRTSYKHIRFTPWLSVYAIDEIIKKLKRRKQTQTEVLDDIHKQNISDRKAVSRLIKYHMRLVWAFLNTLIIAEAARLSFGKE